MRVSLMQLVVDDAEAPHDRWNRVVKLVEAEQETGADLIVLPELWVAGGFDYKSWSDHADPIADSEPIAALEKVRTHEGAGPETWLHFGSYVERAADGTLYNTSVFRGPGGVRVEYRKIHRFGFSEGEATLMGAGEELVTVPSPWGTLGLATCYDLRFPELFRGLLDRGMEHLVISSAWPAKRIEHWRVLLKARAIEDQVFVFATNCVGTNGGVPLGGRSAVIDPWGNVVAEAGTGEEVLRVDVDPALVAQTRGALPVLNDRRLR
ncbi:carbon-nitrogen family hydrolase [Catenulispora sp. NF23]|nr:carbon-nitrogen family hydrolase [Catenulispora pinistramenti]MBS2531345.1 carbon-nitrogen family hydrolase [Catenulispora pinistramenti]